MKQALWVIVPAAGVGKRMAAACPKQYLPLGGMTILDQTLSRLLSHPQVAGVALGLAEEDAYWPHSRWYHNSRISRFVGGLERSDTVMQGLIHLRQTQHVQDDFVLVHDAARPLLSQQALTDIIQDSHPCGALLAIAAKDTIKQVNAASKAITVASTLDRSYIWQAQTPQKFRAQQLLEALEGAHQAGVDITDESSALEFMGYAPALVAGDASNIKVTTPSDLIVAEALIVHLGFATH